MGERAVEELIHQLARAIGLGLDAAAVLIVAVGSIDAAGRILAGLARMSTTHGEGKIVWRRFGMWLLLALEFELASDIVTSVVAPSWQDLGRLGAIAVIRTFLNYFLEKDVSEAVEVEPRAEPAHV
jgi:uncharacterized membrane protein